MMNRCHPSCGENSELPHKPTNKTKKKPQQCCYSTVLLAAVVVASFFIRPLSSTIHGWHDTHRSVVLPIDASWNPRVRLLRRKMRYVSLLCCLCGITVLTRHPFLHPRSLVNSSSLEHWILFRPLVPKPGHLRHSLYTHCCCCVGHSFFSMNQSRMEDS